MRSYYKTTETAWGVIPIQLKSEIPVCNITGISVGTNKSVYEFTIFVGSKKVINEAQNSSSLTSSQSVQSKSQLFPVGLDPIHSHATSGSNHHVNDDGSVISGAANTVGSEIDDDMNTHVKVIKLRAPDAEVRHSFHKT